MDESTNVTTSLEEDDGQIVNRTRVFVRRSRREEEADYFPKEQEVEGIESSSSKLDI